MKQGSMIWSMYYKTAGRFLFAPVHNDNIPTSVWCNKSNRIFITWMLVHSPGVREPVCTHPLLVQSIPCALIQCACTHPFRVHSSIPCALTRFVCTHPFRVHSSIPCALIHSMCTHPFRVHLSIPCALIHSVCTHPMHVHSSIPCALIHFMCTHLFRVHSSIPCALIHFVCTNPFHVHSSIPWVCWKTALWPVHLGVRLTKHWMLELSRVLLVLILQESSTELYPAQYLITAYIELV